MRKTFLLIFLCVLGVLSTSLTVSSCSSKDDEEENKSDSQSAYKDSIRKDSIYRDSIRKVSIYRDSIRKDSIYRDSIRKVSIYRDSLHKDSLSILEKVLSSTTTSITVKKGDVVAFYNAKNGVKGLLTVTEVSSSSITFTIDGLSYTLGDSYADASYLTYANSTYATSQLTQAKANPTAVVLVKLAASQDIASGTKASNTTISGAATETVFVKK